MWIPTPNPWNVDTQSPEQVIQPKIGIQLANVSPSRDTAIAVGPRRNLPTYASYRKVEDSSSHKDEKWRTQDRMFADQQLPEGRLSGSHVEPQQTFIDYGHSDEENTTNAASLYYSQDTNQTNSWPLENSFPEDDYSYSPGVTPNYNQGTVHQTYHQCPCHSKENSSLSDPNNSSFGIFTPALSSTMNQSFVYPQRYEKVQSGAPNETYASDITSTKNITFAFGRGNRTISVPCKLGAVNQPTGSANGTFTTAPRSGRGNKTFAMASTPKKINQTFALSPNTNNRQQSRPLNQTYPRSNPNQLEQSSFDKNSSCPPCDEESAITDFPTEESYAREFQPWMSSTQRSWSVEEDSDSDVMYVSSLHRSQEGIHNIIQPMTPSPKKNSHRSKVDDCRCIPANDDSMLS
ncbi:hypothetical protein ABEB36_011604 [Hypothenemus hampei]|uniref:Uncharacterized protein n=1 Tax=Hypothenemus hampei TaxID=57062 RepID=A0ABD1E8L7_HYPHA